MKNLLEAANANLASAPRPFPKDLQKSLKKAPAWTKHDELGAVVRDFPTLYESGRVVLAARVMANVALFAPGDDDSAMLCAWSEDEQLAQNPRRFLEIAHDVFDLKDKEFEDARGPIAKLVTDELSRPFAVPLPDELSGGAPVFLSALLVFRAHLPCGFLSSSFLPLLVCPEKTKSAAILPASLWPDAWKDR